MVNFNEGWKKINNLTQIQYTYSYHLSRKCLKLPNQKRRRYNFALSKYHPPDYKKKFCIHSLSLGNLFIYIHTHTHIVTCSWLTRACERTIDVSEAPLRKTRSVIPANKWSGLFSEKITFRKCANIFI